MKLHVGALPDNFEPDATWRSIVEPSPLMLQLVAAPIALATGAAFFVLWHLVIDLESPHIPAGWETWWPFAMILSFPLLIVVHEIIHAVFYPNLGLGKETLIGCWPSRMLFYAYYDGPLPRDRFLLVFSTPFLIISVLPLLLAALVPLPEIVGSILGWFSIWNATFSCGDILGFFLILVQVPRRAIVRNKSWQSFWTYPGTTPIEPSLPVRSTVRDHEG